MLRLPVIKEPFRRIAADMVGPLVTSREDHRFLMVILGYCTLYLKVIPLRSINARETGETGASESQKTQYNKKAKPRDLPVDDKVLRPSADWNSQIGNQMATAHQDILESRSCKRRCPVKGRKKEEEDSTNQSSLEVSALVNGFPLICS